MLSDDEFYWHSDVNNCFYSRNIKFYSSKTAIDNINANKYKRHSELFGVDFIAYPKVKITKYFSPKDKMSDRIALLNSKNFEEISKLKKQDGIILEVVIIIEDILGIGSDNLGITGSALWDGLHEKSDADIIIYGIDSVKRFISNSNKFLNASERIKKLSISQIYDIAQKFSFKTGLDVQDCVIYTSLKKYLFYYLNYYLSIAFCPTFDEIRNNPLADEATRFINLKNLENITITAEVKNLDWGFFYPALVYLENIQIENPREQDITDVIGEFSIIRIVIFEREISGYFKEGNRIEVRGLLQKIEHLPENKLNKKFLKSNEYNLKSNECNSKPSVCQLIIGTIENYGNEYIKNLDV